LPEGRYDWDKANALLESQLGTQDRLPFTYRPAGAKTTTVTEAQLRRQEQRLVATFAATGYTRHLIRNWMAAAIAVARGETTPQMGHSGFRGRPAPAAGLCLWSIDYEDDPFF
jgi:tRNA U38,U39,U40 pseudouridine synthase TruA